MIDLHAHILPGVDDGVRSLGEAVDVARTAAAQGVTAIAATPHVRDDYPTTARVMRAGVGEVAGALAHAGVDLQVLPGGEIDLGIFWQLDNDELAAFSLGGGGAYVLLEFPDFGWPRALDRTLSRLRGLGLRPVFAHPERNPQVQDSPASVRELVDAGGAIQVTAGSLTGRLGPSARLAALTLLDRGLVHLVGSDVHGPHVERSTLADAAAALNDDARTQRLLVDAPAAIVAGEPLPV